MKLRFWTSLLLFLCTILGYAQTANKQWHSGALLQAIQKLNVTGKVLYIAAHPDDENTGLLAYLAHERKYRTGYLSLTRGDGGQNLIGKEQGLLLGLIRTRELLAAREVDGAEQFFTRANDFGFSKSPDEALTLWDKEQILSDVVWTIRRFRPNVIICRFPTTGEGGHGHHTASAILAQEAFTAAADPTRFPEQLKYTTIWHARRLFWNTFNFGEINTTAPNQLKLDIGGFNPLLGLSYGEIAANSRSCHKSQGFGTAKSRGATIEYFKQLAGDSVSEDIFERIENGWGNITNGANIAKAINNIQAKFDAANPSASTAQLIVLHKMLIASLGYEEAKNSILNQKLDETEALILATAGIWAEAISPTHIGVAGEKMTINSAIICKSKIPVTLEKIKFIAQADTNISLALNENKLYTFSHQQLLPANTQYSEPYWLQKPIEHNAYVVNNQMMIGKPENTAFPSIIFTVKVDGYALDINRELLYKYTHPVKGEIYRPFEILPPVTLNFTDKLIISTDKSAKEFSIKVIANKPKLKGKLTLISPNGWATNWSEKEINLAHTGDEIILTGTVANTNNNSDGNLFARIVIGNDSFDQSIYRIEYDHIPYQFNLEQARLLLKNINVKKANNNIAYIAGAGDEIPTCLKQIGYNVTMLNEAQIAKENLDQYSAIVTGIRAYNIHAWLQNQYGKLMDYVKNGGNLIVQYNTNNRIGPVLAKIGPYPFTISQNRVTDEQAPVTIIASQHPVLNVPNKITEADFENWVQERGTYFATELDSNYTTILSMADKGEKPSSGSLIISKYGKGNFVYAGLAFFRQLPAGNAGAYRLFTNLLSLPRNK